MPRTKQVRKKSSVKRHKQSTSVSGTLFSNSSSLKDSSTLLSDEYDSTEHLIKEFNVYYNGKIKEYQQGYEKACKLVKQMFIDNLCNLPESIKSLNVNNDVEEESLSSSALVEDQNKDPNNVSVPKTRQSRARKPAKLSDFKKPKTPRLRTSRKRSVSVPSTPGPSSDCFKTPLMSSRRLLSSGMTIAPKISDRPMCVLRRPVHGEMAISMSGSPLMVGAFSTEDIPTVNVPLQDGRIISIVPEAGAPPPDIPIFDETTKKYLKTLRAHLEILAPNSP
uniref:Borealin C-terminal domain-containing protein n=1 Tax=Cuerna arida TaxID=1464854 RepID=A0A1B6H0U6_9HEMI